MIARPSWSQLIALAALAGACTKAQFTRIDDGQGTATTTSTRTTTDTQSTCAAPQLACASTESEGLCDPVCQTRGCDWCTQKCSYTLGLSGAAQLTCSGFGQKGPFQPCTPGVEGGDDDCAPGSICLPPIIGDRTYFCFPLCRVPGDCPGEANCGTRKLTASGGEVNVCDPQYDQVGTGGCDPIGGTGCDAGRTCFLVSPDRATNHSRTVCDYSYGGARNGDPCTASRDCMQKYTCVNEACRLVCDSSHGCPNGADCSWLGSDYGYCM